jgi:orotate phosphoribosyltransferase
MAEDQLALDVSAVSRLTGKFKLRSGQIFEEYFDKYRFESDSKLLRRVALRILPLIPEGAEVLAGLELGGVPIATAMSLEGGLPAVFVRKKASLKSMVPAERLRAEKCMDARLLLSKMSSQPGARFLMPQHWNRQAELS